MKYLTVNIKPVYDYRKKTTANSGSAKGGLACFDETFVVKQTFVLRMNICTKNPALHHAAYRYAPLPAPAKRTHQEIFAQSKTNTYF